MIYVAILNIIIQAYIVWVYIVKCIMCLLADYAQLYMLAICHHLLFNQINALQHWIVIIIIILELSHHAKFYYELVYFLNLNLLFNLMQADMQNAIYNQKH